MAYGFSKTQSVLDNETWESLRIVNEQSPTTKLVSEKLREIVTRLLSKSAGQYNINDFEFLVSDNKDIINAFFINSLHTKNGKNVIGITPELIRFCETENELAAVIAHELGHFTYGKLFAYDENSVFQERASDLYAVNLLIDGGFNPYAYRNVAERLFLKSNYKSTTNALAALDIHGGDFARVEDVEIYMTKLKKERGFLPSGNEFDNGKWRIFQNQFERALSHDHFKSYVEQTWGNKKLTENNIDDFLDFIRTGMESGQLHSECRLQDCAEKLAEYTDRIPKPETSEKTLGKIQQLTPYFCKKSTITKRDASFLVLDALCVITSPTKLKLAGEFIDVAADMQQFIDAQTKEQMYEASEKLNTYNEIKHFYSYFDGFPKFVMPNPGTAVGSPLPYARHMSYPIVAVTLRTVFNIPQTSNYGLPQIKWPNDIEYEFQADKNGIITSVGIDAEKLKETTAQNEFLAFIDMLQKLLDVQDGKITADDFWRAYPIHPSTDTDASNGNIKNHPVFGKMARYEYPDVLNQSPYDEKNTEILKNSAVYERIIKSNVSDTKKLAPVFNTQINTDFFAKMMNLTLALIEKTTDATPVSRANLLFGLYAQFTPLGNMDWDWSPRRKYEVSVQKQIQTKFVQYASKSELFDFFFNIGINDNLMKELSGEEKTSLGPQVLKKNGINMPTNAPEFSRQLELMRGANVYNIVFVYYIYACLKNDLPVIDDLEKFLDNNVSKLITSRDSKFSDELARYIQRHNLFPKNDFNRAAIICNYMQGYNLYSAKIANQSEHIGVLVDNIKSMPIATREHCAFCMLAGAQFDDTISASRIRNIARFPNHEKELMQIYVDAVYERIGPDNNTPQYMAGVNEIIEKFKKQNINRASQDKLFRLLSDKIISQDKTSQLFNTYISVDGKDIKENDFFGRAAEGFLAHLETQPGLAKASIEFLNTRLSQKSIDDYKLKLIKSAPDDRVSVFINREFLEFFYNSFWDNGLDFRAVIMGKLLNRISEESGKYDRIDDQIKYVCNMHFPTDSKYRDDAEMIFRAAITSFESFEQTLILAAIASADENRDEDHKNASKSVGDGLRMFFENMGPAWVKFGQLLSYVPELPSEIRHDLGKLKDKADIPARWELFESIKNTLPDELLQNTISVDQVLGAGSFWVTAKIKFVDKKSGVATDKVLSLLRPNAWAKAKSGFDVIEKTISKLAQKDEKYKSLLKVARQARASAEYEVDVVYGNTQFERAKKIYGNMSVEIDGKTFTPNVADWEYYGVGKDGVGYKMMDLAMGRRLDKVKADADVRRQMALAYVTLEIANLFKGDVWDIDRHMGQQNFDIMADDNVEINIYDTGAQMNRAPDTMDKVLLADVLYELIRAARTGIPLDVQILDTIKKMDTWNEKYKINTNYVADVQKGLMALSDIIEYQKEIKDKDGNVIQERLTLGADDLANAIEAAFDAPTTDAAIKMPLAGRILVDRLHKRIKSFGKDGKDSKKAKNPVQIKRINRNTDVHSVHFDKPESEIAQIQHDADAEKKFGINRNHIAKSPDAKTMEFVINQNARRSS